MTAANQAVTKPTTPRGMSTGLKPMPISLSGLFLYLIKRNGKVNIPTCCPISPATGAKSASMKYPVVAKTIMIAKVYKTDVMRGTAMPFLGEAGGHS